MVKGQRTKVKWYVTIVDMRALMSSDGRYSRLIAIKKRLFHSYIIDNYHLFRNCIPPLRTPKKESIMGCSPKEASIIGSSPFVFLSRLFAILFSPCVCLPLVFCFLFRHFRGGFQLEPLVALQSTAKEIIHLQIIDVYLKISIRGGFHL